MKGYRVFRKRVKRVQCKDCGFLTFDREWGERRFEESWGDEVPSHFRVGLLGLLACFNDVCGFDGTVVNEDRECSEFFPWHQGFVPKEHRKLRIDDARSLRVERMAKASLRLTLAIGLLTVPGVWIGLTLQQCAAG